MNKETNTFMFITVCAHVCVCIYKGHEIYNQENKHKCIFKHKHKRI